MKNVCLIALMMLFSFTLAAQTDSTSKKDTVRKSDSVKIKPLNYYIVTFSERAYNDLFVLLRHSKYSSDQVQDMIDFIVAQTREVSSVPPTDEKKKPDTKKTSSKK